MQRRRPPLVLPVPNQTDTGYEIPRMEEDPRDVAIVGAGIWGSAIAQIIGVTVKENSSVYNPTVKLWFEEEMVEGKKLSEIINTKHENVKYLAGKALPTNVVAIPDIIESVKHCDILVFVMPHQFIEGICKQLRGKVKTSAKGISLIKDITSAANGSLKLVSDEIKEALDIPMAVMMGANMAQEVADNNFCEATIGCKDEEFGMKLKKLFSSPNFQINVAEDAHTVELCGALKNIVACGAGFTDGLGYGDNTKAAVIRLGLMEMKQFIKRIYPRSKLATFFESCGIADLIATCYGGRNRKVAEAFVKTGKCLSRQGWTTPTSPKIASSISSVPSEAIKLLKYELKSARIFRNTLFLNYNCFKILVKEQGPATEIVQPGRIY